MADGEASHRSRRRSRYRRRLAGGEGIHIPAVAASRCRPFRNPDPASRLASSGTRIHRPRSRGSCRRAAVARRHSPPAATATPRSHEARAAECVVKRAHGRKPRHDRALLAVPSAPTIFPSGRTRRVARRDMFAVSAVVTTPPLPERRIRIAGGVEAREPKEKRVVEHRLHRCRRRRSSRVRPARRGRRRVSETRVRNAFSRTRHPEASRGRRRPHGAATAGERRHAKEQRTTARPRTGTSATGYRAVPRPSSRQQRKCAQSTGEGDPHDLRDLELQSPSRSSAPICRSRRAIAWYLAICPSGVAGAAIRTRFGAHPSRPRRRRRGSRACSACRPRGSRLTLKVACRPRRGRSRPSRIACRPESAGNRTRLPSMSRRARPASDVQPTAPARQWRQTRRRRAGSGRCKQSPGCHRQHVPPAAQQTAP